MSNYRVKQFIWAVTSIFKKIDTDILKKYLDKEEIDLFNKLSHSDKHHCIRVCNDALNLVDEKSINVDKNKLAKIALLHDVGKSKYHLNPIDKSILVILNKVTKGKLKSYTNYKRVDAYYNHPKKGLTLLKGSSKYDKEFLEVVEKHHYKNIGNNVYLKVIKECDDNN